MKSWTHDQIPDQNGRTALVTGANTGIGFETALSLARKGAKVILACRNAEKGQSAVERILQQVPTAEVSLELLDLADLNDVQKFSHRVLDKEDRLDLLILNAGVMVPPEGKTAQGFELQFGINHLGHFALVGLLLPLVQAASGSRIVVVSSTMAAGGKIQFDDLQFEQRGYAAWPAYGQSKLANQLFVQELKRRLRAVGSTVSVTAAHPGWTRTDLQRNSGFVRFLNPLFSMKPQQGALPTLRAATDPQASTGDYFGPSGLFQMRGYPKRVSMVKRAKIEEDAARLWQISEELTGVHFDFGRN
ncbi:MAG: SDR family NAD(P)-dependent oxidoreductase [Planctomycetota bacterium]|nr:MAG: SDR family NAD(P)-dependent oxidoreductase [Planctomycetota bacterium]